MEGNIQEFLIDNHFISCMVKIKSTGKPFQIFCRASRYPKERICVGAVLYWHTLQLKTPIIKHFRSKENAQILPKQNNFEKVQKTTFLTLELVKMTLRGQN